MDVDTVVARYNVEAYQSGKLETVDMNYLDTMGYSAVPYVHQLTTDSDPEIAERAKQILGSTEAEIEDFRGWNYSKARALEILEPFRAEEEAAIRALLKEITGLEPEGGTIDRRNDCQPRMVDGMRFVRIRFEPEEAEKLEALLEEEGWKSMPLDRSLQLLLFNSEDSLMRQFRGSCTYHDDIEGYWFFRNLNPDGTLVKGFCKLFFCYYNKGNHSLYLFECDQLTIPQAS